MRMVAVLSSAQHTIFVAQRDSSNATDEFHLPISPVLGIPRFTELLFAHNYMVEFTAPIPTLGSLPQGPFCPVFAANSGGQKTGKLGSLENLVLYYVEAGPKLVDYTTLGSYTILHNTMFGLFLWRLLRWLNPRA